MNSPRHHIAHILPFPSLGGTEVSTLRIARALEGERYKHTAFCLPGPVPARGLFADAGFDTADFDTVEPSYRRPQAFLSASFKLAQELKRRKVDLVHCADLLAAHFTAVAGRLAGVPVVCHIRNPYERISRRDQTFLYPVNRFVFVSKDSWARFGYRVRAPRGGVIYDGIDVKDADCAEARRSVRREFSIPDTVKLIGMVARVAPQKDYATLARAAAHIRAVNPNVRFMVIGDHSRAEANRRHYEEVQKIIGNHQVAPYFIFTDHREDVGRLLSALDISVLCTHHEGFGLVILEAMAQAKPVVATATGGTTEIITHGENGLFHEHQNDRQLAAQLLSLFDEGYATRLGEAGRRLVKEKFSAAQFINQIESLYRELLDGPQRSKGSEAQNGAPSRVPGRETSC